MVTPESPQFEHEPGQVKDIDDSAEYMIVSDKQLSPPDALHKFNLSM